jgi:glycosyltransferase involved in cell wall biosynthesis
VISDLYPPIAFGGYERSCAAVVDGLSARHTVAVLTSDLRRAEAPRQPGVRRELTYLGPRRREALRVPLAAARAATVTRRVLADTRPDIVYVWNCLGASQAAPLTAAQSGVPVAYRFSELWFASSIYRGDRFVGHLAPRRGLHRPWSWLVRGVNHHPALRLDARRRVPVAVSWGSDDLRARATLPQSVAPVLERTNHPGVSGPFGELERRPAAVPTIVYVGRLTTAKGAELAVQALGILRTAHAVDARLVLAGPSTPTMARTLRGLAQEAGVGGALELTGPLETSALARLLASAHVLVVPTVTHEVFGRVCVEAALARVPVVAARVGGIPEALRDGEHALLFEPGDAGACAAALAATLRDREAAEARAARAFAHVQGFSVERFVAAEEAFLEDAVRALRTAA